MAAAGASGVLPDVNPAAETPPSVLSVPLLAAVDVAHVLIAMPTSLLSHG